MKPILKALEVAAFPVVAILLFATGLFAAVAHLVAMPGLYLWERYLENRPRRRRRPDEPFFSRRNRAKS
ncbi:hypothetical protein [Variovorax sp. LT1R20]|uniref:hypothetical protein n=1 Tax=Variovorax sp. LT1R20 TaxID=3443729 RepID=UPI003F49A84B